MVQKRRLRGLIAASFMHIRLAWVMLFSWPLMCAIKGTSARIGRVTGRGITGNLKQHYARAA